MGQLEQASHVGHGIMHSPKEQAQLQHALDNAKLAENVYKDDGSAPPGWERIKTWNQKYNGFYAAAYRNLSDGHVVVAFRGTEPTSVMDWVADGQQALGGASGQYANAISVAQQAQAEYGASTEFTGHSLGGGLASAASLKTGLHADTFNPANLNPMSYAYYGLNPFKDANVDTWRVNGEILGAQPLADVGRAHSLPAMRESVDANGNKTFTPAPEYNKLLHPIKSVKEAVDRHSRYIDGLEYELDERIKTGLDTVRLGPSVKPAALATSAVCTGDMHNLMMKTGSQSVLLSPQLKPMSRRLDATTCNGAISQGLPSVLVGN
jgi:hypothetical protein